MGGCRLSCGRAWPDLCVRVQIVVYVERNLGFEAEYMERELRGEPNVVFYKDEQASRSVPVQNSIGQFLR